MIKNFLCAFVSCFSFFLAAAIGHAASPFPGPSPTILQLGSNPTSRPQTNEPQEQEQSTDIDSKTGSKVEPSTEPSAKPNHDARESLGLKLRDEYWEAKDKKGAKRKAEPTLFDSHDQMTRQWVAELSEEDVGLILADDPTDGQAKRVKGLLREYNKRSQEVVTRFTMARRLAKKIMLAHWQSLAQTGVEKVTVPEYARDFENTVESWFLSRSIEDLKIFEKTRPSKSERERGDKITAELVKKIDEVKQKYEGDMR